MAKYDWQYCNSTTSHHGLMLCSVCRTSISGDYKVRETKDGFITIHRSCSASDKGWLEKDKRIITQIESLQGDLELLLVVNIKLGDRYFGDELYYAIKSIKTEIRKLIIQLPEKGK